MDSLPDPENVPKQEAKTPFYFHAPKMPVFAFAGIWQRWERPDAPPAVNSAKSDTPALLDPA